MDYIYLSFSDLSEEAQEEIVEIGREELKKETTQKEADNLNMELDDLINERVDAKLQEFSHRGRFVFNI